MSLYETIRVLYYNWKVILLSCMIPTITIIYLTKNMDKKYQSSAMLYTGIASGFSIESNEGQRVDYHVVNNAFDNLISVIKSRQTLEEVAVRLLAKHLMMKHPHRTLGKDAFEELKESYPMELRTWVDSLDYTSTLAQLWKRYQHGEDPIIRQAILGNNGPYSIKSLSKIEAKRIKSSDMVQLVYQFSDPGICQGTLEELLEVFVDRYKGLKTAETGNVVAYFEKRLAEIKGKLTASEDKLTDFRSKNRVINYGEQTKAIAIKKQNALEEYSSRKMNLQATRVALKKIEEKLEIRESILNKNAELLSKKQELTQLTSEIALYQVSAGPVQMDELLAKQNLLRNDINNSLHELFNYSNSKEGLPSRQLLNDWLNHLIAFKKEEVQVNLFSRRLAELNAEYDHFAPLGSTIDRYEREIGVFEREFLEVLHGLNMAKLKQQNIELSSSLNVLDWPKYPNGPLKGKRVLLIALCFAVGFVGAVSVIIIQEMLDNTLREPHKAQEITGLAVLGGIPIFGKKIEKLPEVKPRVLAQVVDQLNLKTREAETRPIVVALTSVTPSTGKTLCAELLVEKVSGQGVSSSLVQLNKSQQSVEEMIAEAQQNHCQLLFVELPALAHGDIRYDVLEAAHLNVLVERADRSWSSAHERLVNQLFQVIESEKVEILVNGIKFRFLEKILGEIPGTGNPIKSLIKRALKFERMKSSFAV